MHAKGSNSVPQRTETKEGSCHPTLLWWRQHLCTSLVPTVKPVLGSEITASLEKTLRLGLVACKRLKLGAPKNGN